MFSPSIAFAVSVNGSGRRVINFWSFFGASQSAHLIQAGGWAPVVWGWQ